MKKQLFNFKTIVVALCMLVSGAANAFTAVTSGNWSSAATWGGTAPGANVLASDIIIPAGITVTLDMDVTFTGALNTFSVGGTLSSTSNNMVTFTQGSLSGAGTVSIYKVAFTNISTASFAGTMNVKQLVNSSNLSTFVATANVADSLILQSGSLVLSTNSNLMLMTNSTVRVVDGLLNISGGVLNTSNNYNVMYTGTSKNTGVELNSSTIQNVYVNMNSNSETVTLTNNMMINTKLQLMKGQLSLNGKKLSVMGDIDMASGTMLMSNNASELMIQGSGNLTSGIMFTNNSSVNKLTIDRNTTVKLMSGLSVVSDLYLVNGNFSLESGSTLTMNSGSNIHVATGSLTVNSGAFVGTNSYNVEYMGGTNTSAGVELTGSALNNVTVNYTNTTVGVSLTNNTTIAGKLDLMSGHLMLNGKNLILNGTVAQTSSATITGHTASELHLNIFTATTPTLWFDVSTGPNNSLSKLKINTNGVANVMVASQLMIVNELMFVQGKLMLDNNDLIMMPAASITGFNNSSYVVTSNTGNGHLKMNVTAGGTFVTFPVGTNMNYSPAYIQQLSAATTGNLMVRAIDDVFSAGYSGLVNSNSSPLVGRTWFIEAESGVNVNMTLKLGWTGAAELNGFNRNTAMIRHYTNGNWDTDVSAAATAGANSTFELSRTGITSLSPFAVADASAPLKVKELTKNVGLEVYPNPAKDVLIVEMSNFSGSYKYELNDVLGKKVAAGSVNESTSSLDVSNLKPGYYFVKIISADNTVATKRFLKD